MAEAHEQPEPFAFSLAAYTGVVVVLLAASGAMDRYPVGETLALILLVLPALGAALLVGSWRVATLVLLAPLAGCLIAMAARELAPLGYGVAGGVVALPAVIIGTLLARRVPRTWRPWAGAALLAGPLLVMPWAVVQRHRTIHAQHAPGWRLDERAGTLRGVGLGDPAALVQRRLGPGRQVGPEGAGPLAPNVITGPSSLSTTGLEQRYGDHLSFLLDEHHRVQYIEVTDHAVATTRGVGPGDSLSVFRRAYPELQCDEGAIGSDELIPFPECRAHIAPHRWLYVGGTYDLPGEPAVVLLLARRRIG